MKIEIKTQYLFDIIKKFYKIVPLNSINEINKQIKIEVLEKNLIFWNLNEKTYLKAELINNAENLIVYSEGRGIIELKVLFEILSKIKDEWISLQIQKNTFIISNIGDINIFLIKLNLFAGNTFPKIEFNYPTKTEITFSGNVIEDVINKIAFVIDINNVKEVLRGINFIFSQDDILVTAADNISLAQKHFIVGNNVINSQEITVPFFLLNDIMKIINNKNELISLIVNNEKNLDIKVGNFFIRSSLLQNKYLKIHNLIKDFLKSNNLNIIKIKNVKEFLSIVDLVVVLSKKDQLPLIQLNFMAKEQKIKLLCISNNNNIGEITQVFDNVEFVNFHGTKDLVIVFNYLLLTHALKSFIDCHQINLNIENSNKRMVITSNEENSLYHLVLPFIKK